MAPIIRSVSGGCQSVTITWFNENNTATAQMTRDGGVVYTTNSPTEPPGFMSHTDQNVRRGSHPYTLWNFDNRNPPARADTSGAPNPACTTYSSGFVTRTSAAAIMPEALAFETLTSEQVTESARILSTQSLQGDFVLQVPQRDVIQEFRHQQGDITGGIWQLAHTLKLPPNEGVQDTSITLIQNLAGRFEAIVRATPLQGGGNDALFGYELNEGSGWQGPVPLVADDGPVDHLTGSQAFIRSDDGEQSFFELLVVRGPVIYHYRHTTDTILEGTWHLVAKLNLPNNQVRAIAISLNQSPAGKLEAMARFTDPQGHEPDFLAGYEFNGETWQGPVPLVGDDGPINHVTGSQTLFQNDQNTFELLVPRGSLIFHYTHEEGTILKGNWHLVAKLPPLNNDNQTRAVSVSLTQNAQGNLELVARERSQQGQVKDVMVGYVFSQDSGWTSPSVLQSDQGPITASDSGQGRDHNGKGDDGHGSEHGSPRGHGHDGTHGG